MKIALIIDRFEPARGGAEAYLEMLAGFLRAHGHQVRILCWRSASDDDPAIVRVAAPAQPRLLREIEFARRSARRAQGAEFDVSLAIRHALDVDVYQPHGGTYVAAERATIAAGSEGLSRWRALLHRLSPKHILFRWLERRLLARDVTVVALSRMVAGEIERLAPAPARIQMIYNGVDLARFHPQAPRGEAARVCEALGWRETRRFLLHVAHNHRLKGLRFAVRALAERDVSSDLHLVHVGRDRPGDELRLARRMGLAERVLHAGAIADVAPLYRSAAALVHPTFYDPCSLVTLEALACGLPVVTTARNGAAEMFAGTAAGEVIDDPRDVTSLARSIATLLERGDVARRAAREVAESHPWQDHFAAMERVLVAAAAQRARGSVPA